MANSYTDQLKLRKPTFGDGNWDDEINGNSQILEVALAAVLEDNYTVSGLVASDGGGLNVDYTSGVVVVAGTQYAVDAGSKTATDNTDGTNAPNFLYVDSSGVMQISITPPTGEYAPIAVVDTASADITRVGDLRLQKTLDYETGTWTVTLYDASSGGNASPTTTTGYYTKIGNVVNCWFSNLLDINTAGMTAVNILNFTLPFSAAVAAVGSIVLAGFTYPTNRVQANVVVSSATTRARIQGSASGISPDNFAVASVSSGSSDIGFMQLTYLV
jgi:hypothetical protein